MNETIWLCPPASDKAFGPVVNCENRFDFTLAFEQYFFSIVPSAALLLVSPFRLQVLWQRQKRVDGKRLRSIKLVAVALFAASQLALIPLVISQSSLGVKAASTAGATLSFLASLVICNLSYFEHSRSIRPSMLLNGYLLISLVLDSASLRTMWLMSPGSLICNLFTLSFSLKGAVLLLEARAKRDNLLRSQHSHVSPEETSGLYSHGVFWWLNSLLRQGFQHLMKPEDLYQLPSELDSSNLNSRFENSWKFSSHKKYKLIFTALSILRWPIVWTVVPRLLLIGFSICQPLIINGFLTYLQDPVRVKDSRTGWAFVGAYAVVYLGMTICTAFYWYHASKVGSMLRGTLITAIFAKTTQIKAESPAPVTLMSTDVDLIARESQQVHELWANIIQIGVATWLLQREIGLACFAPIGVAIFTALIMGRLAGMTSIRQGKWIVAIQKRIGITTSIIGSIKGIKILGLSNKISEIIESLRVAEIAAAKSFRYLGVWTSTLAYFPLMLSPVMAFAIFVGISLHEHETLNTSRLFTSLSLLLLISQPLFSTFLTLMELMSLVACFQRIDNFLSIESRVDKRTMPLTLSARSPPLTPVDTGVDESIEMETIAPAMSVTERSNLSDAIKISGGTFGWSIDGAPSLQGINLTIPCSKLTMLVGPVASGKSTLLKAILGEIPLSRGGVHIASKDISWCEQAPWLINDSVQNNIIGFSELDRELYSTVVAACALGKDIAQMPDGHQTIIGSKGITLSGGQKQRIAIARALYSRNSLALFDDVFSGLDRETQTHVFYQCFSSHGLLRSWGVTIVLATHATNLLQYADQIIVLNDSGIIAEHGTFLELNSGHGYVSDLIQSAQNGEKEDSPQKKVDSPKIETSSTAKTNIASADLKKSRQVGDITIYRYYFRSVGWRISLVFFFVAGCWGFFNAFPTVWLKWWAEDNQTQSSAHATFYVGIYSLLQVLGLTTNAVLVWLSFNVMVQRSGLYLHNTLLRSVLRAPLSFFSETPTGSLITRFSQDLQLIDSSLPLALMCVASYICVCIAQTALVASSSVYITICLPALLVVLYFLQKYYLRTSRQLRHLVLDEKAPVYSQFIETLSGLSTIRAFGWEKSLLSQNYELVNRAQRPFHLLLMVQRWLGLVLDLITTALAIIVVSVAVQTRTTVSVGFTGVSLVQLISLTEIFKLTIAFWAQLETSIGAVARTRDFSVDTENENLPGERGLIPQDWPAQGRIEIRSVSAAYVANSASKVLDGLDLTIQPGQKIGICGRTGSGKSSVVMALLRMLELSTGTISFDGVDISTIPRDEIRSRINCLGQDPCFLPGTFRLNMDPCGSLSDDAILAALKKVHLWALIEARGGLDSEFDSDVLSIGQQQLFCLSRATLRPCKIVILDEVTSSVDKKTDDLMQQIIREEFSHCTVIAIAHRLETIRDSDKVAVLENGILVEFDSPEELLQRPSRFREMYGN